MTIAIIVIVVAVIVLAVVALALIQRRRRLGGIIATYSASGRRPSGSRQGHRAQ